MTNRRTLFGFVAGIIPAFGIARKSNPRLATGCEIIRSFDAQDWARNFVEHARQLPGLATDEETMVSWFANALMRGYDEARRNHDKNVALSGEAIARNLQFEAVQGAVARGWCSYENRTKEMDVDLGMAIAREVMMLRYPAGQA